MKKGEKTGSASGDEQARRFDPIAPAERRKGLPEPPVLAVTGYADSGKTSLMEAALPILRRSGLAVAVLKHAHSGFDVDRPGSDTARHFASGADPAAARVHGEFFLRSRRDPSPGTLAFRLGTDIDLLLLEGHKRWPYPKVWLQGPTDGPGPGSFVPDAVLPWEPLSDRVDRFVGFVDRFLGETWRRRPLMGGILIGGRSERMGCSKALLSMGGQSLAERTAGVLRGAGVPPVLLGCGELPPGLAAADRLPDVPGLAGPMAGLLSAMRWAPGAAWILTAVDMPRVRVETVQWLLTHRRPGVWAVIPRRPGRVHAEPLLACYEPMIRPAIEGLFAEGEFRLRRLLEHPRVIEAPVPENLEATFTNVNTPQEWKDVSEAGGD